MYTPVYNAVAYLCTFILHEIDMLINYFFVENRCHLCYNNENSKTKDLAYATGSFFESNERPAG